ncbi:unnamed protein product, partial [Mycena citricolor]
VHVALRFGTSTAPPAMVARIHACDLPRTLFISTTRQLSCKLCISLHSELPRRYNDYPTMHAGYSPYGISAMTSDEKLLASHEGHHGRYNDRLEVIRDSSPTLHSSQTLSLYSSWSPSWTPSPSGSSNVSLRQLTPSPNAFPSPRLDNGMAPAEYGQHLDVPRPNHLLGHASPRALKHPTRIDSPPINGLTDNLRIHLSLGADSSEDTYLRHDPDMVHIQSVASDVNIYQPLPQYPNPLAAQALDGALSELDGMNVPYASNHSDHGSDFQSHPELSIEHPPSSFLPVGFTGTTATPPRPSAAAPASFIASTHPGRSSFVKAIVGSAAHIKAAWKRRKVAARFECPVCQQSFTAQHNLNNHLDAHIGARRYCPYCKRTYATVSNLKRHLKKCEVPGRSTIRNV